MTAKVPKLRRQILEWSKSTKALMLASLCATAASLAGCDSSSTSLTLKETLTIAMIGVFEAPADAIGNAEPKSLAFTLTGVSATDIDGTVVDLFEGIEPTEYTIISRSQIIFDADLADHVDTAFTQLDVTFAEAITGAGKYEDEMTATLTNATASYANAFTVETAKAVRLDISVQWKSIVTRDDEAETETMSSPAFVAELAE